MLNNGKIVSLSTALGPINMYDCRRKLITKVDQLFYDKCRMEGTCMLADGR